MYVVLALDTDDIREARKWAEAIADTAEVTLVGTFEEFNQDSDNDEQPIAYLGKQV